MQNISATGATQYDSVSSIEYLTEYVTDTPADFEDPNSGSLNINRVAWPAVFTALIIGGNLLSLMAFCVEKRLRTYNNYFIINLSILDLLIGLHLIVTVAHTYLNHYPFPEPVCKVLFGGINKGIVNASNLAVVVICADRYRATYDPVAHYISRSKRKAIITSSIAWLTSFVFWLGYATVWEFVEGYDSGPHCVPMYYRVPITNVIPNITNFYLPFVIIAVLNVKILVKIHDTIGGKSFKKDFTMEDTNTSTTKRTPTDLASATDNQVKTISGAADSQGLSRQKKAGSGPKTSKSSVSTFSKSNIQKQV